MSKSSDHMQRVSMKVNSEQIAVIRRAFEIVGQTDDQIATGVVVNYMERCRAKPHLSITSYAYADLNESDEYSRLDITLTEGQLRLLDKICAKKREARGKLIRWIIADTAEQAGYPR